MSTLLCNKPKRSYKRIEKAADDLPAAEASGFAKEDSSKPSTATSYRHANTPDAAMREAVAGILTGTKDQLQCQWVKSQGLKSKTDCVFAIN